MLTKTGQIAHKNVFLSMLMMLLAAIVTFSTHAEASSITYTYDDLNRLTTASRPDGSSFSYNYDDVGNIIQMQTDAGSGMCDGDLSGDGVCDMEDWHLFGEDWGRRDCFSPPQCECDINQDGRCDIEDWVLFRKDWGRTDCP